MFSKWITERGKPECAVCIPNTAVLSVQSPGEKVRGAQFEHREVPTSSGHYDFLHFIDGEKEVRPLNSFPLKTNIRVLQLYSRCLLDPISVPAAAGSSVSTASAAARKEPVPVPVRR